ncbi:hypothetical protein NBH00_21255 [Paraconexibacter antarcticus]|uniref:P-type ATPase A domain-containing protein n=1 Tax=Paraconexibacter antarcticus TaxID=2949664 RepID=A0ABY5DPA1_9ACTN|nr:hypothetical protein [Paraconexibacter antarcticus]UTI63860.1 hypothetical protein NBH00_21255 [Paraconexibacter antarcticus]
MTPPSPRLSRARTPLRRLADARAQILAAIAVVAIAAGFLLHALGAPEAGHQVWRAAVALLAAELAFEVVRTVVVDRHLGVDTIALVAMLGALALDEELAGAVIGLMFTGGAALEAVASRRARRELTLLVQRAPRVAQLHVDGAIEEIPVDQVRVGDTVLVRSGEVIPVDGTVASDEAVVDTSTLSGEPLPLALKAGMAVRSGSANAGAPFDVRAGRPAAESAYAAARATPSSKPRRSARRSCAWPTATPASSCPSRSSSPRWPGRSAATPCARWRSWSSRRRARSSSPRRSPSCRGCPRPRITA